MSPVKRRLLLGAATNWLAFVATLIVGVFLTPYLVRSLGDGPYGVWQLVENILAYFSLFDLGIAASVERYMARYQTTGERNDRNRLVSTCLALFLAIGLVVFALGAGTLPFIFERIETPGVPDSEVVAFAILMLGSLAATLPLGVFPATLDGLQFYPAKNAVRIGALIVRTVGIVAIMEYRPSLLNLGFVYAAISLLEYGALAAVAFWAVPGLRLSWRLVDMATIRQVRGYSLYAFLAMIAGRVTVQSGSIIIGAFFGSAAVTPYALASKLVEFSKALSRTATNTLTPAISSLETAGHVEAIRLIFLRGTRWVLYLMLPVHLGLVIFGRPFLIVWTRKLEYAASYPSLAILSSTLTLVVAQSVAARILYGLGRLKWFARMALLEGAVNVVLSIVLCPVYGIEGVAVGVAVPNLLMCLWVIGYTARVLDVSVRTYIWEAWLRPTACGIVPAVIWLWAVPDVTNWWEFLTGLLVGLVPFTLAVLACEGRLSLSWFLALGRRLRDPGPPI